MRPKDNTPVLRTCHRCGATVAGEVGLDIVYFRCRGHVHPRTKNPCLHAWRERDTR